MKSSPVSPPDDFGVSFGVLLRELRTAARLRQIEVAVEIPVDHSLVSRWETGAVLPTEGDLESIFRTLALDEEKAEKLHYAWLRERNRASSEQEERNSLTRVDWAESLQISIEAVRALRKSGQPRVALLLSRRDAADTFNQLRSRPWKDSYGEALGFLSELLLEECKAGLDYLPQEVVRAGYLSRALKAQALAISGSSRPGAPLFHTIAAEGVAYVSGNIGDAHVLSRQLLANATDIPIEWLPEVVRACAINSGKLADTDTLALTEKALNRLLDERNDLPLGTHAFILEGLARGWAGIDPRHAIGVIEKAWETRNSAVDSEATSSLRFVQLVRSQAEVELTLRYSGNTADTLRKLEEAVEISKKNQYDKYIAQLEALAHRLA